MKKVVLCLLVIGIGACSWRSPQSKFYMMDSVGLQPISQRKMKAVVARVKVPDILDKAQIVVSRKHAQNEQVRELEVLEFHRWGEVFPEVLQNTVTNDLMAYLPDAYIERSYFDSNAVDYSVNIEINNIQAYIGDKVVIAAWWNVRNARGNVVKQKQGTYEVAVDGGDVADLVNAESQAVHQLSADIAGVLAKL